MSGWRDFVVLWVAIDAIALVIAIVVVAVQEMRKRGLP